MDLYITWAVFFEDRDKPARLEMVVNQGAGHLANSLPGYGHGNDRIAVTDLMSTRWRDPGEFTILAYDSPAHPLASSIIDNTTVLLKFVQRLRATLFFDVTGSRADNLLLHGQTPGYKATGVLKGPESDTEINALFDEIHHTVCKRHCQCEVGIRFKDVQ